jgi:pimeloyl-ACP methyl ester carboxylesterase
MATYVFVHGAFQGGWVWGKAASILRGRKNEAHTPTLTGCGDRSHLLREDVDLHTYIKDITNFLYFENLNNVILVSHGYSGVVASAVIQAKPNLIRKVIYLDAAIPEQGKSYLDLAGEGFGYVLNSGLLYNSWLVKPLPSLSAAISRSTDRRWFEPRLVNFPLAAFTTPFPGKFDSALFDISFIRCKNGSDGFMQDTASAANKRGWDYHELQSGHLPMVSAHVELAELLMAIGD